jgi:hypothetical protein
MLLFKRPGQIDSPGNHHLLGLRGTTSCYQYLLETDSMDAEAANRNDSLESKRQSSLSLPNVIVLPGELIIHN